MSEKSGWNRIQPVTEPGSIVHQMALNETCHPPLPAVVDAVRETAAQAHRTLDALGFGLSAAIGEHLGVPPGDVLVGPGSGALLQLLFSSFTGPGTHTVHAWPSWEAYPMMAENAGSSVVRVPLTGERHDLDAMAAAVTDRTRMVVVCNPNNPTGTVVGPGALGSFLERLPAHVTVVIDEAYLDFADPDRTDDGIELYRSDERVCVVRTFSKSYGLLSLRVGYLVGHPPVLGPLRGHQLFLRVSAVAQAAAVAALGQAGEIRERCRETARERDRLHRALTAQGWASAESQANFVWLPLEKGVEELTQHCADHGVMICGKPGEGIRVTIAEREANNAFAALAAEFRTGAEGWA
ncbi:aminotransferase class I/II-fold pyridoxal phosphate-dependent enzyme [Streptomyces sp. NBC_01795]|uniref:aminotransferase class I/II-fold pyridoxal phosphate-dependent enzyme n=1 Tax=Streptomyces sp. NBC_01795 TaxID=2975943 RepID=UPI002DD86780|nr:aminotransferase class I/II-fold pyridoxal phosphate-dependent enzyme [Streptomyces sp. NBC_01795]WSA96822.1 aminotransferase class I/II-fold pyridoxal phosphate-dependent enzyme [Streptomyces sp. NBC_01795]